MTAHIGSNRRALPPPHDARRDVGAVPRGARGAPNEATKLAIVAFAVVLGALLIYAPQVTVALLVTGLLVRSLTGAGRWVPRRPMRRIVPHDLLADATPGTPARLRPRRGVHPPRRTARFGAIDWRLLVTLAAMGVALLAVALVLPPDIGIVAAAVGFGGLVALRIIVGHTGIDHDPKTARPRSPREPARDT